MAIAALTAVVAGNLAWTRVNKALQGANPGIQESFRMLKIYLAQQKKNPDLNIAFFSQADSVLATGAVLTGAPTIYGIYAKKGTVATASYLKISDDATAGGVAASFKYVIPFLTASEEKAFVDPNGTVLAAGIAIMSHTTVTGATVSTGASTGQDGFIIYSV